jgi:hypothetical protein
MMMFFVVGRETEKNIEQAKSLGKKDTLHHN